MQNLEIYLINIPLLQKLTALGTQGTWDQRFSVLLGASHPLLTPGEVVASL